MSKKNLKLLSQGYLRYKREYNKLDLEMQRKLDENDNLKGDNKYLKAEISEKSKTIESLEDTKKGLQQEIDNLMRSISRLGDAERPQGNMGQNYQNSGNYDEAYRENIQLKSKLSQFKIRHTEMKKKYETKIEELEKALRFKEDENERLRTDAKGELFGYEDLTVLTFREQQASNMKNKNKKDKEE